MECQSNESSYLITLSNTYFKISDERQNRGLRSTLTVKKIWSQKAETSGQARFWL